MKEWLFVFNPHAGKGKAARKLSVICKQLDNHCILYDMVVTSRARHATLITREYINKGCRKIIAVGGDGTINEVISGIVSSGRTEEIVLGIIPLGGGNDFVKNFAISADIKTSIKDLIREKTKKVNIAKFAEYYFINSFGIGFDAQVARYALGMRYVNGILRYLLAVLRALLSKKSFSLEIEIDGKTFIKKVLLVSVGNGKYIGGGFKLTPDADPTDEYLDVCIIEDISIFRIFSLLPSAIKGNHTKEREVYLSKGSKIRFKPEKSMDIYFDGEIPETPIDKEFVIEIIKEKVNLVIASGEIHAEKISN